MIRRDIKSRIYTSLDLKEITIITGARQVGKTTLLKEIITELKNKGEKVLYFNLDIEEDSNHFVSQQKLLNKIRLETGSEKAFIFIDEIQQKENAGKFLKGIYDMELPYKFIVTGSGSLELKEKISEALTGRKYMIEMSPVGFIEFVNYKTQYRYEDRIVGFFNTEEEKAELLLNEFLTFGGYPAVITADTALRKQEVMNEIFTSYITKDVSYLLGVRHPDKFVKLIQLLAVQSGCILNYSQLAQDTGIRFETLKTYLWYAEQTYIINTVKPFFTNLKKELTKSPTVYFNDLGMLNFSKNNFAGVFQDGMQFQNFVYSVLKEKYLKGLLRINYWRTKDKAEVDFIVHTGKGVVPVEVKFKKMGRPEVNRSFRRFLTKYKPLTGIIVNLNLDETVKVYDTEVFFIPFWKLQVEEIPPE
jgi:predicted AAA+ superfamily ATPase